MCTYTHTTAASLFKEKDDGSGWSQSGTIVSDGVRQCQTAKVFRVITLKAESIVMRVVMR